MSLLEMILIPFAIAGALAFLLRGIWKRKAGTQPSCGGSCSCKPSALRK